MWRIYYTKCTQITKVGNEGQITLCISCKCKCMAICSTLCTMLRHQGHVNNNLKKLIRCQDVNTQSSTPTKSWMGCNNVSTLKIKSLGDSLASIDVEINEETMVQICVYEILQSFENHHHDERHISLIVCLTIKVDR